MSYTVFEHWVWGEFLWFADKESILFFPSQLRDDSVISDKPCVIMKEAIKDITGLYTIGDLLGKKIVKKKATEEITGIYPC